jgi:NitT/TauT family transport system substrate-binding protein
VSFRRTLLVAAIVVLGGITLLHGWLNLGWFKPSVAGADRPPFRVGFLPVTCHLTCPVTDFINKQTTGASMFDPVRFRAGPS